MRKINRKDVAEIVPGTHLLFLNQPTPYSFSAVVVDEPRTRTIFYRQRPYLVATPYIYYGMRAYGFSTAVVSHLLFSRRFKLSGALSRPMLPNVVDGVPCYPRHGRAARTVNPQKAILKGLIDYWQSGFNDDDDDMLGSWHGPAASQVPAWDRLAKKVGFGMGENDYGIDRDPVLKAWEQLSIDEVLALPWPPAGDYINGSVDKLVWIAEG